VGLFFAFGQYNPVYAWLAQFPGFNLFRVPARWLALFALGVAMLAGIGLQALPTLRRRARIMAGALMLAVVGVLAAGAWRLTARNPEPVPATPPEMITLVGWGLGLLGFMALLMVVWGDGTAETQGTRREEGLKHEGTEEHGGFKTISSVYLRFLRPAVLKNPFASCAALRFHLLLPLALILLDLWLAARALPYNQLVPPEVVNGQRFSISQMRAYAERDTPPGRLLSISDLLFDPGDRAALEARYAALGMSAHEVRTALVAIKMQEVVAANLPLLWGIPSIDGFDGGVLPTTWYSAFASLLTPSDALRTVDGRLREILAREECRGACLPDPRWLALTNTRYLLIDKVYDLWHEDVAYDTGIRVALAAGEATEVTPAPFVATAIDVLVEGGMPALTITLQDGTPLALDAMRQWDADVARVVWRYALPAPAAPLSITLTAGDALTLHALTLVDTRVSVFQQVTLGDWRRVLSSDIKIYENLAILPRAFVVYDAIPVRDDYLGTEDALAIMRDPAFDPAQSVVVGTNVTLAPDADVSPHADIRLPRRMLKHPAAGAPAEAAEVCGVASASPRLRGALCQMLEHLARAEGSAIATITAYADTRVEIAVESAAVGYLVLSDAYYEGWQATVNGAATPILRADVMFRAVPIPAGESVVVMEYRPGWLAWLPMMGLLWVIAVVWVVFRLTTPLLRPRHRYSRRR
jgi:hypothetical protein